ncbi:MAG: CYTH domain-containing protein [Kordiimonadaceae bacterium]|nr:CYTH domain-containing protein [Kordiimonadaceae bacterium]
MSLGVEIERKFLIRRMPDQEPDRVYKIRQGYIAREHGNTVRVRERDSDYILSIKTQKSGPGRNELEFKISKEEADILFSSISHYAIIKKREIYKIDGVTWELDIFEGVNKGLIIAEVELVNANDSIALPDWIGPEVTSLSKFYNANIADMPFESWRISYEDLVDRLSE